jgi:hypothetical protein
MQTRNLMANSYFAAMLTVIAVLLLVLAACSIHVKKGEQGEDKRVDIQTPVGGIHVSKDADEGDVGLPVYPGARKKEKDDEGEEKSANVNISAGKFALRVVAIEYESNDSPDKLVSYYRDQLKKYGKVLECHTTRHGQSTSTGDDDDSNELKCEGDNNGKNIELKVGTKQNQHIVAIETTKNGKGCDFGLVHVQIQGKDTV